MSTRTSISCLIVEDEPLAQDQLVDYVEAIPHLNLVGTAANAQQAIHIAAQQRPDLVLLDIRMPRMNGFELLRQWPGTLPLIVVTTAYEQYALEGYKFSVVDYLVKPLEFTRFKEAIRKVEQRLGLVFPKNTVQITNDLQVTQTMLSIKVDRKVINVPLEYINYCEAYDNYVKIYTPSQYYVSRVRMSRLESVLPATDFIRISRSHIVRIDEIQLMESNAVRLFNGVELAVGVTYRGSVDDLIKKIVVKP